MADFAGEIQTFQRYGNYTYKPDSVGNFIFDSSSLDFSRVYFSLQLKNVRYHDSKIESFYDTTFSEFVPIVVEDVSNSSKEQEQVTALEEENTYLKSQLDTLIDTSASVESDADLIATKQVILELRILLKQGRVDSDFSEDFPYAPIKKINS
jgi:hypothetical protein